MIYCNLMIIVLVLKMAYQNESLFLWAVDCEESGDCGGSGESIEGGENWTLTVESSGETTVTGGENWTLTIDSSGGATVNHPVANPFGPLWLDLSLLIAILLLVCGVVLKTVIRRFVRSLRKACVKLVRSLGNEHQDGAEENGGLPEIGINMEIVSFGAEQLSGTTERNN